MPGPESGSAVHVFIGGRSYRFGREQIVTFGRDPEATIRVTDDRLSRWHAQLRHGALGWELEDLGSSHGTYVGEQRVTRLPISSPTDVWLDPPGRGVAMRLQPAARGQRRRPARSSKPSQGFRTLELLLLISSLATIGVGVFLLDWVTYDVTGSGLVVPQQGAGLDFDAGVVSAIAGGISGLIGVMGLQDALSRQVVGFMLVVGAAVTAVATVYFVSDVEDQTLAVPGLSVTIDATLAAGGPVTLAGAGALALTGLIFMFDPARR